MSQSPDLGGESEGGLETLVEIICFHRQVLLKLLGSRGFRVWPLKAHFHRVVPP
jgi:hypothetical protein